MERINEGCCKPTHVFLELTFSNVNNSGQFKETQERLRFQITTYCPHIELSLSPIRSGRFTGSLVLMMQEDSFQDQKPWTIEGSKELELPFQCEPSSQSPKLLLVVTVIARFIVIILLRSIWTQKLCCLPRKNLVGCRNCFWWSNKKKKRTRRSKFPNRTQIRLLVVLSYWRDEDDCLLACCLQLDGRFPKISSKFILHQNIDWKNRSWRSSFQQQQPNVLVKVEEGIFVLLWRIRLRWKKDGECL